MLKSIFLSWIDGLMRDIELIYFLKCFLQIKSEDKIFWIKNAIC